MNGIKAIVCDLDGTLAESKSSLQPDMAEAIGRVLEHHYFAVVSGGDFSQFEKQFLGNLSLAPEQLSHLLLFPTSGAECVRWSGSEWKEVYDVELSAEEKRRIIAAFGQAIEASGIQLEHSYGDIIEDRGEQITFSGRGQHAPLAEKAAWDPDRVKRTEIVRELADIIPEFEIEIGGATSIDITHKGINKAYAIRKMEEILGLSAADIVFIGDALYPGGNDARAREAGVQCIQVSGPAETKKILLSFV